MRPINPTETGQTQSTTESASTSAKKRAREKAPAAEESSKATTEGANIEVSSRAKELKRSKEIASGAPDTREAKIAELKKKIAEKKYQVDADKIADRLVEDHLSFPS